MHIEALSLEKSFSKLIIDHSKFCFCWKKSIISMLYLPKCRLQIRLILGSLPLTRV